MVISDLEAEDIALLSSLAVSTAAVIVDDIYNSTLFKALKIIALVISIGLAIHRIKTGKPYFKDIAENEWVKSGDAFEVVVSKSEHNRGKFPHSRLLISNGYGGYSECLADADVQPDGRVIVRVSQPTPLRLEIRK